MAKPQTRTSTSDPRAVARQILGSVLSRGRALDELHTEVYRRFGLEGIEIPFPQRDVHLRSGHAPE